MTWWYMDRAMLDVFLGSEDSQTGTNNLPVNNVLRVIISSTSWCCHYFIVSQPSWKMTQAAFQRQFSWFAHLLYVFIKFYGYSNFVIFYLLLCIFLFLFPVRFLFWFFSFKPYKVSTALQTFSFYTSVTTTLAALAL